MREIDVAEIKAKRQLELMMVDLFEDADKNARRKSDLPVSHSPYHSAIAVMAVIAVSVVTSLATVMMYCEWHHLLK